MITKKIIATWIMYISLVLVGTILSHFIESVDFNEFLTFSALFLGCGFVMDKIIDEVIEEAK